MHVVKLRPFGVEVTDLDLSEPRTKGESAELLALFDEHYLLVVRDQHMSDDDHRRVFHDLFPGEDLGDETGTGSDISYVSNVRPDGQFGDDSLAFHSDFAFTTQPTRVISLYGYEVDPGAGATEFANGELALEALPADLVEYLRDKQVVSATDLISVNARIPSYNLPGDEDLSGRRREEIVRAAWPVIMNHPRTGRPLLFVNENHAHHLQGVPLAEGREVIERLCGYLYVDERIYRHDWQEGDFVLWDNIALAHGRRATPPNVAKRTLRRLRTGGATRPTMVSLGQFGLDDSDLLGADAGPAAAREQSVRRTVGQRIRSRRLEQGLSQREVVEATGIDFQQLAMVELGAFAPSIPELCSLAGALDIDPGTLVEGLALTPAPAAESSVS
jgi:taurine dioxygenase